MHTSSRVRQDAAQHDEQRVPSCTVLAADACMRSRLLLHLMRRAPVWVGE